MATRQCLIIVPRHEPDLCARLMSHFASNPNVLVRFDLRTGDQSTTELRTFAVGGGNLDAGLQSYVEEQLRLFRT